MYPPSDIERTPVEAKDTFADSLCSADISRRTIEHDAFVQIRKSSVDPYNRLHSINEDAKFVRAVYEHYNDEVPGYPLLANLRCGAWYTDPSYVNQTTAYFKSSDGHYNGWSFNLRRPNLHILPLIRHHHGVILVDSTRAGKRMPDSFSKTVPIWSAVINRALKLRNLVPPMENGAVDREWDTELHIAPQSVGKSESSQIEARLDAWAEALAESSYELPSLTKSIRPIWITPATTSFPELGHQLPFYPVICVSASKLVEEGLDRRRESYSYVQGSGDDHEHWSSGLTPNLFWKRREELLSATQEEIQDVIKRVVSESQAAASSDQTTQWSKPPVGIGRVSNWLTLGCISDIPARTLERKEEPPFPCLLLQASSSKQTPSESMNTIEAHIDDSQILRIPIPSDKKASERAFKSSLSQCLDFAEKNLENDRQMFIACETGKDLSIGVALAVLQAFFDDGGNLDIQRRPTLGISVNKDTLRTRLQWIIASKPDANPSRATLKRVNEFFMSSNYK